MKDRSFDLIKSSSLWNIVFAMTMLVYAAGLFVDIMEPDAAVYAQVSMEMHDRHDLLSIYHKGADWLDKPHFPFWITAVSYQLFGVNTFAYKLPAVFFILLAALYTFLFARKFYSALHGWIAVIVLITAQHIIISNQDVRAEPFLTGLLMMAMYHFASYLQLDHVATRLRIRAMEKADAGFTKGIHAILGALALACLVMTKGLFTIIPVVSGIGLSLIYQGKWKTIFHWQWLVIGLATLAFLLPSIGAYYLQFDMHPEKKMFGEQNVSGVKFFLWTSQWGRFTNTGPIKGKGDLSYFVHTLLWAFLPWAFAAFFALYHKTKALIKRVSVHEQYTYFGFITLFLIFSVSSFQLSFYLNQLFPFLAILTTAALLGKGIQTLRVFANIHTVLCGLLLVALITLHYFFLNTVPPIDTLLVLLAGTILAGYIFTRKEIYLKKIIFATALVCLSVNYYLNREFYPALLHYQAESAAAHYIRANHIPADKVVFLGDVQSVADILLHYSTPVVAYDSAAVNNLSGRYVFTSEEGVGKMDSVGLKYHLIKTFDDFPVTRITGKFINKNTRSKELKKKFLFTTEAADLSD